MGASVARKGTFNRMQKKVGLFPWVKIVPAGLKHAQDLIDF